MLVFGTGLSFVCGTMVRTRITSCLKRYRHPSWSFIFRQDGVTSAGLIPVCILQLELIDEVDRG